MFCFVRVVFVSRVIDDMREKKSADKNTCDKR
jgi:hypothetical protein